MDVGSLSNLCWSLSKTISNLWGLGWLYLCVCLPFSPWITCLEFRMLPLKALWVFCFDLLARWWSFKRTLFRVHDFRQLFSFHTRLSTLNFSLFKTVSVGDWQSFKDPIAYTNTTKDCQQQDKPPARKQDLRLFEVKRGGDMETWNGGLSTLKASQISEFYPWQHILLNDTELSPTRKLIPFIWWDTTSLALTCMPHSCQPR